MRITKGKIICGLITASLLFLSSCTSLKMIIHQVSNAGKGNSASPVLFDPIATNLEIWEGELRPQYSNKLEANVYGIFPDNTKTHILKHEIIDPNAFRGKAVLEHFVLQSEFTYQDNHNLSTPFHVYVVRGDKSHVGIDKAINDHANLRPMILTQSFCPNNATLKHPAILPPNADEFLCPENGIMSTIIKFVFGRYIATPPIEMILDQGYDFATMAPSQFIPDQKLKGSQALSAMTKGHKQNNTRLGAIGAWSIGFSHMIDAIEASPVNASKTIPPIIAYGHSRYAKSALLAGANDPRIKAVIAHQSGTGGASLNKDKAGETLKDITTQFPHWFAPIYGTHSGQEDKMDFDQHALLALNAPHPVLLGNAKRDIWSDPNGAFRAAKAANIAYGLYGKTGLIQDHLTPFNPKATLSFYLRPGTHGVVKEDWPAFLSFLDAHFYP